jgi:hypothetical protein
MRNQYALTSFVFAILALVGGALLFPRMDTAERKLIALDDDLLSVELAHDWMVHDIWGGPTPSGARQTPPMPPLLDRQDSVRSGIAEIGREAARAAVNGGVATIILADTERQAWRNFMICVLAFDAFSRPTPIDARLSQTEERLVTPRPLYWMYRGDGPGATCDGRLAYYDFRRAARIRDKLGLRSEGPILLVTSADERDFVSIDLSRRDAPAMAEAVRYFRTNIAYAANVWMEDPKPAFTEHYGSAYDASLLRAITAAPSARTRYACALGDLFDGEC